MKFRIYRMALIDEYQGDDDQSMQANNTSAFNCRTTDRGAMSRHAFGMAVDIESHSESLPGGKYHVTGGGDSLRPAPQTQERYCRDYCQRRRRDPSLRATGLALGWELEKNRLFPSTFRPMDIEYRRR